MYKYHQIIIFCFIALWNATASFSWIHCQIAVKLLTRMRPIKIFFNTHVRRLTFWGAHGAMAKQEIEVFLVENQHTYCV